jgi:hypothetical protein
LNKEQLAEIVYRFFMERDLFSSEYQTVNNAESLADDIFTNLDPDEENTACEKKQIICPICNDTGFDYRNAKFNTDSGWKGVVLCECKRTNK